MKVALVLMLGVFSILYFLAPPKSEEFSVKPLGLLAQLGKRFDTHKSIDLKSVVDTKEDNFALYVKDLNTGKEDSLNYNKSFYAASLFKVPVAISILQKVEKGELDFSDVDEPLTRLLKNSDNNAQDVLLGLADQSFVNELMQNGDSLKVIDVAKIFEKIYNNEYLNETNSKLLIDYMVDTSFDDRIHLGFDVGAIFSHKIGNWPDSGTWHDCGILLDEKSPKILCLMSEGVTLDEFLVVAKSFGQEVQ